MVASAIVGQNLLGLLIAGLMTRARKSVSAVVGTAVVAAWVLPEIVAAFAAYAYFSKDGTLNQLLAGAGWAGADWLRFPLAGAGLGAVLGFLHLFLVFGTRSRKPRGRELRQLFGGVVIYVLVGAIAGLVWAAARTLLAAI